MNVFNTTLFGVLTLTGFLCKNSESDPVDTLIQCLVIIAPYIALIIYVLLRGARRYIGISDLIVSRSNLSATTVLFLMLFIIPIGERILLNDFACIIFILIIHWFLFSWYYYLEIRLKNRRSGNQD